MFLSVTLNNEGTILRRWRIKIGRDGRALAEKVAAGVALPEKINFVRARQMIREALRENGVATRIDKVVARVLS